MKDYSSVILVDVDEVLVDWTHAFYNWMIKHGFEAPNGIVSGRGYQIDPVPTFNLAGDVECFRYIGMFQETTHIRHLAPIAGAIPAIRKLHEEHGYVFHCVTSFSSDVDAIQARRENLRALFGETAIENLHGIDPGESKREALSVYRDSGCFFIEDNTKNAQVGLELGLNPILLARQWNNDAIGILRLSSWKDIYAVITGERM